MSLIVDALKTAQRQRSEAATPPRDIPILSGFFPSPGGARRAAFPWRGAMVGGILGVLVLGGAFGYREFALYKAHRAELAIKLPPLGADRIVPPSAPLHGDQGPAAASKPGASRPAPNEIVAAAPPATVAAPAATTASGANARTASVPAHEVRASDSGKAIVRAMSPGPVQSGVPAVAANSPAPIAVAPATRAPDAVHVSVQGGAQDTADRLLAQARDAQRQGNVDAAEDVYRKAVATHQADAEIYNNYAALLADRGDTARAITMYKLAIGLDAAYVDAWSNLGELFDASGDHAQATGVFQHVLALDSSNVAARTGLAEQYQALGDYASARKLFEQVTRSAPSYARAHYELAVLLDARGDTASAVREYGLFLDTGHGKYPQMYEDRVRARIAALSSAKRP